MFFKKKNPCFKLHIKHTYTKTHVTVWSEHKYMLKVQNSVLKKKSHLGIKISQEPYFKDALVYFGCFSLTSKV